MADKAGVVLFVSLYGMTLGTVIHFHTVPGIFLIPPDMFSPYIDAVPCQAIFLINGQLVGFGMFSMACSAVLVSHFHMGNMGKIDTVRLF